MSERMFPESDADDTAIDAPQTEATGGVRRGNPLGGAVILGGVATGVVAIATTLALAWFADFNPMGFYMWFIVPIGAIGVGLVAGSGYGVVSWLTGVRIGGFLVINILALQFMMYGGAQYVEYRMIDPVYDDGTPVGFFEAYHYFTMAMEFEDADSTTSSSGSSGPLGMWGYGVRSLEILGFCGGGLIAPLVLMSSPYCESCQRYMKTRELGMLPGGIGPRKVKKSDEEGQRQLAADVEAAAEEAGATAQTLHESAAAGDVQTFREMIESHLGDQKRIGKLTGRIAVSMVHCSGCHCGRIETHLVQGQGDQITKTLIAASDAPPSLVEDILGRKPVAVTRGGVAEIHA